MNKTGRMLLTLGAVALLFTSSCSTKKEPARQQASTAPAQKSAEGTEGAEGDQVKHKVLAFNLEGLTDKGEKKWDVKGETAEAISENEVRLDNIVAKAYGEEAQAVITADQGVYDKSKNNVRLQKNVKATIESTQGAGGGFGNLTGQPGQARPAGDAQAGKKDQKKTKTIITCDGEVEFDYERNIARFMKNVHVDSEDGTIIADKITVNLNADTKQVKDIVAEGNVKIKRGENITYSERAVYDAVTKKVSLTGRPKLVIYQEGGGFEADFMGGSPGKK